MEAQSSTGSEPRQCLYQKFLILMTGGRRAIAIRLRQASGKTGRQRHTVPLPICHCPLGLRWAKM
ncbi:hypothetical protein C0043_04165, partial [Pseudomonas aeruginosa]